MDFQQVVTVVGSVVATVILPLMGVFQFYDAKKRKEEASAKKAEADVISQYANEWNDIYKEEKENNRELNAKIDQLYGEKNEDRQRIRELMSRNQQLELENQALRFKKCEVRGCKDRQPPSDY